MLLQLLNKVLKGISHAEGSGLEDEGIKKVFKYLLPLRGLQKSEGQKGRGGFKSQRDKKDLYLHSI